MKKIELICKNHRECKFYIGFMIKNIAGYKNRSPFHLGTDYTDPRTSQIIKNELDKEFSDINKYNQFVNEMHREVFQKLLPDKYFEWMNDYVSSYFAWSILATMGMRESGSMDVVFASELEPLLKAGGLQSTPLTEKEASDAVINFFDNWEESHFIKIKCIELLKKHWISFHQELPNPFKWVDVKNYEQCLWAYDYVMNHIKPEYIPVKTREIKTFQLAPFLTSVLYAWRAHIDTKRLMIQKMKKTHSQNIYRKSIANKKVVNTYIQKDIKEKLDMLAMKNGRKINEELEAIIMRAWQQASLTSDKS